LFFTTLNNPNKNGDGLAFFINPDILKEKHGEEGWPAYWSDNYFGLLPKEIDLING
jgi:hypothetical protein